MDVNSNLGIQRVDNDPAGGLAQATNSEMGKDEFLKLLTTQLQYQDPLNPLQNHEFVAQLAQFSALEQQVTTNDTLDGVLMAQQGLANAQLAQFVGKEIVAGGNGLSINNGEAQPVGVELTTPAAEVSVTIKDANGQTVRTFQRFAVQDGLQSLEWDGRSSSGAPLEDGRYTVEVSATDGDGNPVTVQTLTRGRVDGVTFENGYPELLVGSARILPAEVVEIRSFDTEVEDEGESPTPPPSGGTPNPGNLVNP